jgi:Kef-type K+ transport system membrane component KefB
MIVSAAVIDDMIALVVLSQLEALVGEITISGIITPVVSALLFLFVGGYVCVFVLPGLIGRFVLARFDEKYHDKIELSLLFAMVLLLIPKSKLLDGMFSCRSYVLQF